MFQPEEIIFAPTARCNLACTHCRVTRVAEELSAEDANSFLRDAADHGVGRLGFSGGEPFLRLDFLCEVSAEAVSLGLLFDRLMTNGDWWKEEAGLEAALARLDGSGFDGTIGLSVDRYHGQSAGRLLTFIKAVHRAFGRRDCVEIASVVSADDLPLMETFKKLAEGLGGELVMEGAEPAAIRDPGGSTGRRAGKGELSADGEELRIDIVRIPYSPASGETWAEGEWFRDDYCAGPGNVFYVHPNGKVAVCCGFANENEQLIAGRIPTDGFETLLARAASSAHVRSRYETGLGETRKRMEADGVSFPGRASDQCFFCDYLCKEGLKTL